MLLRASAKADTDTTEMQPLADGCQLQHCKPFSPASTSVSNIQANWFLKHCMQCIAQPDTTLFDCTLYPMQYPYDPGILPSSANQCILGEGYLIKDTLVVDMACSSSAACEPQTQSWLTLMASFVCIKTYTHLTF